MSDHDLRPATDATGVPPVEELLALVERLVREGCMMHYPGLYDTFLATAAAGAAATLARAGRFRLLWSEEDEERPARCIGFFPGDDVDEEELAQMARMLSTVTPRATDRDEALRDDDETEDQYQARLELQHRHFQREVERYFANRDRRGGEGEGDDEYEDDESAMRHIDSTLRQVFGMDPRDEQVRSDEDDEVEPADGQDDEDGQDEETEMLVDLIENFVRETCESPFVGLYDTFRGGAALQAFMVLADDERFEILWGEDDPDRGDRYIGYFVDDDVDERALVSKTRMLSGLTPQLADEQARAVDEDDEDAASFAEIAHGIRTFFEQHSGHDLGASEDDEDQDGNPELTGIVRDFLEVRDAQHARLVSYAKAALQGLLANGLNSHPSKDARHAEVARDAWAHAHAMLRLDPDYGSATSPDEAS